MGNWASRAGTKPEDLWFAAVTVVDLNRMPPNLWNFQIFFLSLSLVCSRQSLHIQQLGRHGGNLIPTWRFMGCSVYCYYEYLLNRMKFQA